MSTKKNKSLICIIIKGMTPVFIGIVIIWILTQGAYLLGHIVYKEESFRAYSRGIWAIMMAIFAMGITFIFIRLIGSVFQYFIEYCKMCHRFAKLPLAQQDFDEITKELSLKECLIFFLNMVSFEWQGKRHFYRYWYYFNNPCDEMLKCGEKILAKYGWAVFTVEDRAAKEFHDIEYMMIHYMGMEKTW